MSRDKGPLLRTVFALEGVNLATLVATFFVLLRGTNAHTVIGLAGLVIVWAGATLVVGLVATGAALVYLPRSRLTLCMIVAHVLLVTVSTRCVR
jgi:hypothetical protein